MAACDPTEDARMTDAKELVDRYYAALNQRDGDAYEELFSQEVEAWAAGGQTIHGAQAMRDWDMSWAAAFPDARITSLHKYAEGSMVVSENRFTGTHTETVHTPEGEIAPTGKYVDGPYVGIFEVEGGKLTAQRIYYDRLELLTQLGLK